MTMTHENCQLRHESRDIKRARVKSVYLIQDKVHVKEKWQQPVNIRSHI